MPALTNPIGCPDCGGSGSHEMHHNRTPSNPDGFWRVVTCRECSGEGLVEGCEVCERPLRSVTGQHVICMYDGVDCCDEPKTDEEV